MPPALAHGYESLILGICEPQALAQAFRILDDGDAERAEAAHGVWSERKRGLELDHIGVACKQRHPAEHLLEQTRLRHLRERRHGVPGEEELEHLDAHALARQLIEAGARRDARGEPLRVRSALAIGGVEAEEAQDAQIVLGDARCRLANEAHPPRL